MALTSLHVCMDSSDHWLQGSGNEEIGRVVDHPASSPSSRDMSINVQKPMMERRLRPPHDQALRCPRCDSTHTKFCYYNNYSLSQPRYFCKTCRRYWTKGGTLRNVPVGGGCRKNKKAPARKAAADPPPGPITSSQHDSAALLGDTLLPPHLSSLLLDHPLSNNFMESKYDALLGYPRNCEDSFWGARDQVSYQADEADYGLPSSCLLGFNSQFMYSMDQDSAVPNFMEPAAAGAGERLLLPSGGNDDPNDFEMKPTQKMLALEWQAQSCSEVGKNSIGYMMMNGLESWAGAMNGCGSSATSSLL